jgi:hypothetical protein
MNDNKPTRPLSHEEGHRIAKLHATATAQELLGLHNNHPDVVEWHSQEFAEAVQYFEQCYLTSLVNRGLVTPAA